MPDEILQRLKQHLSPPQIVELACVVGFWKFYNTVHDALQIPVESQLLQIPAMSTCRPPSERAKAAKSSRRQAPGRAARCGSRRGRLAAYRLAQGAAGWRQRQALPPARLRSADAVGADGTGARTSRPADGHHRSAIQRADRGIASARRRRASASARWRACCMCRAPSSQPKRASWREAGLLAKLPNPKDRRGVLISLSRAGRAQIARLTPSIRAINDQFFGALDRGSFDAMASASAALVKSSARVMARLHRARSGCVHSSPRGGRVKLHRTFAAAEQQKTQ